MDQKWNPQESQMMRKNELEDETVERGSTCSLPDTSTRREYKFRNISIINIHSPIEETEGSEKDSFYELDVISKSYMKILITK